MDITSLISFFHQLTAISSLPAVWYVGGLILLAAVLAHCLLRDAKYLF